MRRLLEELKDEKLELSQGIKIWHDEGWSLVLPDDEEPIFTVYTEASSLEKANEITRKYVSMINQMRFLGGKLQVGAEPSERGLCWYCTATCPMSSTRTVAIWRSLAFRSHGGNIHPVVAGLVEPPG